MLDTGQIEVTLDDLDDRFRILANREVIAHGRLKEILKDLQGCGLVKVADWMAASPRVDLDLKERQSSEIARSVAAAQNGEIGRAHV